VTRIIVQPSNIEFEAEPGDTIMGAARARGLYWPTTCGGLGICTTCLTEVVSGGESLAEMSRYERKVLVTERGEAIFRRPVRLACQAGVVEGGPVTLQKPGVRSFDNIFS
jgi:2Fe-2S ferredoxin